MLQCLQNMFKTNEKFMDHKMDKKRMKHVTFEPKMKVPHFQHGAHYKLYTNYVKHTTLHPFHTNINTKHRQNRSFKKKCPLPLPLDFSMAMSWGSTLTTLTRFFESTSFDHFQYRNHLVSYHFLYKTCYILDEKS